MMVALYPLGFWHSGRVSFVHVSPWTKCLFVRHTCGQRILELGWCNIVIQSVACPMPVWWDHSSHTVFLWSSLSCSLTNENEYNGEAVDVVYVVWSVLSKKHLQYWFGVWCMPYTCLMYPQVTLGKAKLACWVFQSVCVIHVYSAPFKNEDCVCLCCYIDLHSGVCSAINFSWEAKACITLWVLVNTLNCLFHKHASQNIILQLKAE